MTILLDEAAIPAGLILCSAALLGLVVLRCCVYALGRAISLCRWMPLAPAVEWTALALFFLLTYVSFSFNSGISLLVCGFSVSAAAVLSWSAGSFRVLCVGCFAVVSLLVPLGLSRGVEVAVPSDSAWWTSRYAGEHVRWERDDPPLAPTFACAGAVHRFIYHDDVVLSDAEAADTLRRSDAHRVPHWLKTVVRLTQLSAPPPPPAAFSSTRPGGKEEAGACVQLRFLVSSGDRTHLTWYGGAPSSVRIPKVVDQLALLGECNRLEHTALHCLVPLPALPAETAASISEPERRTAKHTVHKTPPSHSACLFLTPTSQLRNVSITVLHPASTTGAAPSLACTLHIDDAQDCSAALAQVASAATNACAGGVLPDDVLRCLDPDRDLSNLHTALVTVAAPPAFREAMPISAALRRVLPAHAVKVRAFMERVMDVVVLPAVRALAMVVPVLARWASAAWRWLAMQLEGLWPYAQQAFIASTHITMGFLCGPPNSPEQGLPAAPTPTSNSTHSAMPAFNGSATVAVPSTPVSPLPLSWTPSSFESHWSFCQSMSIPLEWEYTAGMQLRHSLQSAGSAVMEAVELVPGVWSAYRWAWNSEVRLTTWCVRALYAVVRFVVEVLPMPVARASAHVLRGVGQASLLVARLGVEVISRASRSSLAFPIRTACQWLVQEELREMRWEWDLVRLTVASFTGWATQGLWLAWRVLGVVYSLTSCVLGLYSSTSFTIHFVVVLAQSVALLMSMRGEIDTLMKKEEEASRRRAQTEDSSPFLQPTNFFTRMWVRKVVRHTAVNRLQGLRLFATSYHVECVRYVLFHVVILSTLLGFSFLPFTQRLYRLTLHGVLPWYSSYLYLSFRCVGGAPPTRRRVAQFTIAKVIITVVLQRTIGDFMYYFLRDLFIAVCLLAVCVVAILAWPHRRRLAREVAEVIADSLNPTPQRATLPPDALRRSAHNISTPPHPPEAPEEVQNNDIHEQQAEHTSPNDAADDAMRASDEDTPDVARAILRASDISPCRSEEGSAAAPQPDGEVPPTLSSNSSSLFTEEGADTHHEEL